MGVIQFCGTILLMDNQPVQNPTSEPTLPPVQVPEPKAKFPVMYLVLSLLILLFLASTAFLYYQNQQLKSMLVSYQSQATPTPSPAEASAQEGTANWKIITSKFWTLRVPQTWHSTRCLEIDEWLFIGPEISEDQTLEKIKCEGGGFSTLDITRDLGKSPIPTSTNQNPNDKSAYYITVSNIRNITIDGQPAQIQDETVHNDPVLYYSVIAYIQKPEYTDIIRISDRTPLDPNTPPFSETKKYFSQILSTFKFTK